MPRSFRPATPVTLDDLTFVVTHFLPHLNRDSPWRILKAEGLNRRPTPASPQPVKGKGTFKDYDLGFIHIDSKHLPKLKTSDGQWRNRYPLCANINETNSTVLITEQGGEDDCHHEPSAGTVAVTRPGRPRSPPGNRTLLLGKTAYPGKQKATH